MATYQKCPLCGRPLSPVGKKGTRMKCDACRSVFDVSQLRDYYGIDTPIESTPLAHDYETRHMHATEQRTKQQKAVQKAQQLKDDQPPVRSGNVLAEAARKANAQAAVRQRPAASARQAIEPLDADRAASQGKPSAKPSSATVIIAVCVLVVLAFAIPLFFDILESIWYFWF